MKQTTREISQEHLHLMLVPYTKFHCNLLKTVEVVHSQTYRHNQTNQHTCQPVTHLYTFTPLNFTGVLIRSKLHTDYRIEPSKLCPITIKATKTVWRTLKIHQNGNLDFKTLKEKSTLTNQAGCIM